MYKNKRILGIIPARGGSKSVPRKNIKLLCGKPLIAYTIEAGKYSKYLTRLLVSTEDQEIAEISREYGADVPFIRPKELAKDESTTLEVLQHALLWCKKNGDKPYDYVMVLQPTSPLRRSIDIDKSIKIIVDQNSDSVMSMYELSDVSLKKLKKIKNGIIVPAVEEEGGLSGHRQDLEPIYKRNCAIYLTRTDLIMLGDMFGKVSRAYIMPYELSQDINSLIDFELAEFFLKKK